MNTPMLDQVKEHLQRVKGRWPLVAEESGVPLRTIEKVARGERENPRVNTVQALYDYFSKNG